MKVPDVLGTESVQITDLAPEPIASEVNDLTYLGVAPEVKIAGASRIGESSLVVPQIIAAIIIFIIH